MADLVVVVGATGNQGGAVARRFLRDPQYRVRGLTRDPTSARAQALAALGAELMRADLDDAAGLARAFHGARLIFTVTDYWEPFFGPEGRAAAAAAAAGGGGPSRRRFAYDVERRHGVHMADAAAATLDSLAPNGFLVSTLSHAGRASAGRFPHLYHFDAKADVFPDYVRAAHPALARKMSCVQTGYFMSSYKLAPQSYLGKQSDGSYVMRFPTDPDKAVPHLDVTADLGHFVYAVAQMPPGDAFMAAGTTCSWAEYMRTWSRVTGRAGRYEQVPPRQMIDATPDPEFGAELADMFEYSSAPGYDGGDATLKGAGDIRQAGVDCPMTSLEDFMRTADWSMIFDQ